MASNRDPATLRGGFVRLLGDSRFLSVMLIQTVVPLSVAVVSPVLPAMATGLGVSDARIGLVVTAITLPPMLLAPFVGVVSDLYGRRTVAMPGLFLFGAAGVAIAFVDDFAVVLLLRGLQGVAMASIGPVVVTILGDLYSGALGTSSQGIRTSIGGLSLALVPLLAGWLAGFSWEVPFYLYAFAFVAMVGVYRYVPETSGRHSVDRGFRGSLVDYRESVREELADIGLLVVIVGGFVRFFSLFGFITFVPIFAVRSLGATPFETGLVVAVAGVRIAVSPASGWLVARFSRRTTLVGALTVICCSFTLVPFAPSVWWLAGVAALHGIGDGAFSPVVNDTVTATVRAENRNGAVGALRVLKEAGKTAAPVVLGVVLAVGGAVPLFLAAAAVVACYALALRLTVDPDW